MKKPGDRLYTRVLHGGVWSVLLRITTRGFGLVRTLVLARLLAPNDFGLFGIAMLALSSLRAFSKTGFNKALIQKKDDTEPYLNSAWTVQVFRGLVLGGFLVVLAPFVGTFFGEPRAVLLVRVLGVAEMIKGFRNIGVVYFRKELKFHKQFLYRFVGTFGDLLVALTIAFVFRSVWALVFGLLARNTLQAIVSYFVHDYRPRLNCDSEKVLELFDFGRWIFASSILLFLLNQGDDVFLGKVLGATSLGLYQLAYKISNVPATEITQVVSKVTFPAYSKLQDSEDKLRNAYLRVLGVITLITMPLAGGIIFLARDFTYIFLGDKWLQMVPALQILALWGAIRSIGATMGPVFQAVGRPDILTKLTTIKFVFLAGFIYPFTMKWGITGTALAVVLAALINNPLADYSVIKTINCKLKNFLKPVSYPLLATLTMVGGLYGLKCLFIHDASLWLFVALILIGFSIYLILILLFSFLSIFDYDIIETIGEVNR